MTLPRRLVVVSNRLPVSIQQDGRSCHLVPSTGGLITALTPVVCKTGGCWIGWTGTDYDPDVKRQITETSLQGGGRLVPVFLSEDQRKKFYCGFSNEIIWPLFHDLQSCCDFDPAYWDAYCEVNEKYADALVAAARQDDFVWVHDYHLMLLADCVRERGIGPKLAYFHHIPFPPPDIYEKLPWRSHILFALLKYSMLGFQTTRDQRNFQHCVRRLLPLAKFRHDGSSMEIAHDRGTTVVGTYPIGIDFESYAVAAVSQEVEDRTAEIKNAIHGKIMLGVDRLDYTKGIPERLKAFRLLLETHHELHGQVCFLQLLIPSREDVPKYRELKLHIEHLVSQINGTFGRPGWVPIHLLHRQVERTELLAYYRAADVALVTSLKDGMNLVAKEFCAAQVEEQGSLILSEFAGAAAELKVGALLVNPYDVETVMEAILSACRMSPEERTFRMRRMRQVVREHDVFEWCQNFYRAARKTTRVTTARVPRSTVVPVMTLTSASKQAAGLFS